MAFYTLNAVPVPVLDLAGLFAYQADSTAKISGSATNALVRLIALQYYLFADGRVFAQDDLTHMAHKANFATVRFHKLQRLPGNVLMTAGRPEAN